MDSIKCSWLGYRDEVIPKDAPPTQISECQLAFYSGTVVMFNKMIEASGLDEEAAMRMMDIWQGEIDAYRAATLEAARSSKS